MTKEERKSYEGRRIVGKPFTEIEGREGYVKKIKKHETLVIVFDDKPNVSDEGYQLEEVNFL